VGGVLGAAILGAIINSTYRDQLEHAVPAPLASTARDSAITGVEVANASGSQAVLNAVRESFVSGMTLTLWVSAALMAAGAVLALVLRPRPAATRARTEPQEASALARP
jgi:MFS transporter, DHA2 family, multidrug resistance protein